MRAFLFLTFLVCRVRYQALMASIKMEEITLPAGCHLEPYLINLLHRCRSKPLLKGYVVVHRLLAVRVAVEMDRAR